jgi:hypothetical protein
VRRRHSLLETSIALKEAVLDGNVDRKRVERTTLRDAKRARFGTALVVQERRVPGGCLAAELDRTANVVSTRIALEVAPGERDLVFELGAAARERADVIDEADVGKSERAALGR